MNKLIKSQLEKVSRLKLPKLTDDVVFISIKKTDLRLPPRFEVDKYFVIQLDPDLLSIDSTLASQWNGKSVPPSNYMLIIVLQILGRMIKVEGVAYNPVTGENEKEPWTGWLPVSQVKIELELEE